MASSVRLMMVGLLSAWFQGESQLQNAWMSHGEFELTTAPESLCFYRSLRTAQLACPVLGWTPYDLQMASKVRRL